MNIFSPKILEEVPSKYSGTLKVIKTLDSKYVSTGYLTQSGGLINDIWNPILKKVGEKNKTWLILGLAVGTAAQIIAKKYLPTKIVGVEIDTQMIYLGKKYFDLDKIPNLEIVQQDANDYLLTTSSYFDFILVDIYQGDKLPDFVYSSDFIDAARKHGSTVIFNHLFYDDEKKTNAQLLVKSLEFRFPSIKLHHVLTNLLIICQKRV
ncbi:MAG: hypothetical protein AAB909_00725 [Patescibacteria group bacterium]